MGIVQYLEGGSVNKENIQQAVVIVIKDRDAAAHRLYQIILGERSAGVAESRKAGAASHVDEPRSRRGDRLAEATTGKDRHHETDAAER